VSAPSICPACGAARGRPDWRSILRRAVFVSLVVGTCLTVINQGDALLHGVLAPALLWKIPLTYSVPFLVSTYSSWATSRHRRRAGEHRSPQEESGRV
jgi:hypothetical protein